MSAYRHEMMLDLQKMREDLKEAERQVNEFLAKIKNKGIKKHGRKQTLTMAGEK